MYAFVVFMPVVGRRLFPALLWQVARLGSREPFTLCVVAAAVSVAYTTAALFGVSFALGTFFAGMMLRESEFNYRAAEETLPLREAFAVLFFVSVGMLSDTRVLIDAPLQVLAVVGIIIVGTSIASAALVLAFRYPLNTALTVSASLAQIGEFSFILAGLGVSLKLLPLEGQNLILAGALISIALNPLIFAGVKPQERRLRKRSSPARLLERPGDLLAELPMSAEEKYLSGQVVLVCYGRVGRRIGEALLARGIPFVVAEQNREVVERLRSQVLAAVSGDAADPAVLIQAHIAWTTHVGRRHAGHLRCAARYPHRTHAQPRHRNRGAHPQRRRSRAARKGNHGPYLSRRKSARSQYDPACARTLRQVAVKPRHCRKADTLAARRFSCNMRDFIREAVLTCAVIVVMFCMRWSLSEF